jgi:hypothetical protein
MTIPAVRLNHDVLFVTDVERSVRVWAEAFGLPRPRDAPQGHEDRPIGPLNRPVAL